KKGLGMKRIRPLVIAVLLVAMGCATVRLEYRADVKLANGNEAEVTYARSYDTSGHMIACIITGLFYGGWCWAYTVMPFASQDAELTRDAERFLQSEFGKKFSVKQTRIIKRGYSNLPLEKDVVYLDEEGDEEEEEEVVETKK